MRILITALLLALLSSACLQAVALAPDVQLLKYSEIMRLSKPKRMEYLSQISQLLILLEKQQAKYETAANRTEELQEQIALLMRLGALMPEAAAEDGDLSQIAPKFNAGANGGSGAYECSGNSKVKYIAGFGGCTMAVGGNE